MHRIVGNCQTLAFWKPVSATFGHGYVTIRVGVMSYGQPCAGALDYYPCRYGTSRAVFRGPSRDLSADYIAMLGGSQTFGKYIAAPYPTLVEEVTGWQVANLGGLNAGPDFYLGDPAALEVAAGARVAVVQITGAEAVSNPFYTVHSRRNDRFVAVTPKLAALFPEVEFTDIHFTRHLLCVLRDTCPDRFQTVVQVLKSTWIGRMQALLAHLPPHRILLWMAEVLPRDLAADLDPACGPLLIDRPMIAALLPEGAARDALELELQVALTPPTMVVKGYSAPETKATSPLRPH